MRIAETIFLQPLSGPFHKYCSGCRTLRAAYAGSIVAEIHLPGRPWSRLVPGPPPLHRPTFPDEFLAEARRLFRARTAASHLRQRAHLVLLVHEFPLLSNVEAAARLDLPPCSIRRWRQRWAGGQFTFEDDPGRGRKPVFSPP